MCQLVILVNLQLAIELKSLQAATELGMLNAGKLLDAARAAEIVAELRADTEQKSAAIGIGLAVMCTVPFFTATILSGFEFYWVHPRMKFRLIPAPVDEAGGQDNAVVVRT